MKILALFFAFFLALLPESAAVASCPVGQDVYLEEVSDVEEEAVLRTPQRVPRQVRESSSAESLPEKGKNVFQRVTCCHLIHLCFERQWLLTCRLRR